jgi:hypothetical protein
MLINYTFDSATWGTAASGVEAQAQAAFGYAINLYNALFTSNVTVPTIDVYWKVTGPGTSAQNHAPGVLDLSYAQVLSDLQAHQDTAVQKTAFGNLPTNDPTGSNNFIMNAYEAEALGVPVATVNQLYAQQNNGMPIPGATVTFNSNEPWSFPPNVQPGPTQDYFVSDVEHEISEVMGRHADVGTLVQGKSAYTQGDRVK